MDLSRATGLMWLSRAGLLGRMPEPWREALRRRHWWFTQGMGAGARVYRCAGGAILLKLSDSPGMVAALLDLHEPIKARALRHFLNPGMTFVDVGANVGQFSLLAARAVGASGRVLSIEPAPETAALLRRSAELNAYRHLEVIERAVSDAAGRATLHLAAGCGMHSLCEGAKGRDHGEVSVPVLPLDDLLAERDVDRVHAIKIDVEGLEMSVLRGGEGTLRDNPGLVLFIDVHVSMGRDAREVAAYLSKLGYRLLDPMAPTRELAKVTADMGELLAVSPAAH